MIIISTVLRLNLNKKTHQTGNGGTKDIQIMVPVKYLSNFWTTSEMSLINCEIDLFLTCSTNCFITAGAINNQLPTSTITDTKYDVSIVILSAQDNAKLLQ